jgi:hypothetical protein
MRRILIVSVLVIAAGVGAQTRYVHELTGTVHNADFNFTYASDWKNHQIVNYIRNDHTEPLVVFWREGGITRPVENPLLPHGAPDQNSSSCPEKWLDSNPNSTITYGLSDHTTAAGVYLKVANARVASVQFEPQTDQNVPDQMISEIKTDIKGEPVQFQAISQRVPENIEYYFVFVKGKPTNFAFNLRRDLVKYFDQAKVSVKPDAAADFKFEKLPLQEQVPNFKAYSMVRAVMPKTFIKIPAKNVQIIRQLLFLLDSDSHILASGYVTLHVPA